MSISKFPDLERLTAGLTTVFYGEEGTQGNVTILNRQPNIYESTFPSEIVTCCLADDRKLRLFCKYGLKQFDSNYDHRGNVFYEAKVYRDVLQPLQTSAPFFYGVYEDTNSDVTWLIVEYLENGVHLSKMGGNSDSMISAARWIGQFHAANEVRLLRIPMPFLIKYDAEYYIRWARRANLLVSHLPTRFLWLSSLCEGFVRLLPRFLTAPQTIIHGEYYPHNIICQNGDIRPVDWQSTAIAVGEIDLAALTEGWPKEIAKDCELQYRRLRWPEGKPDIFEQSLDVARLYMTLRWLGELGNRPIDSIVTNGFLKWLEKLHCSAFTLGERLGLV